MATYTVNISGTFNATYGYLTINGEKITAKGTKTYTSKPTIKVYVSSSQSSLRSKCEVVFNDAVVKSGDGEYTLSTDATTINIVMLQVQDTTTYLYYCADIATETNTGGGEDSGGGEYTRLNYIGTTGTQYIDTGFKPNQNTRVVIDFQADNDACHIFGARTEFLNKGFLVCWNSDFVYSVQVANSHFNGGVFDLRARHTIDMTASEFKLDGVSQATYSVDAFQAEYNLYLASCPNSNESENMQGKIYSCKVYDNGTLVRDFIPCKTDSGEVGLWDEVNAKFYGNSGSGTFSYEGGSGGGNVSILPDGYTRLNYIQSTGKQYIDTGFRPSSQNVKVDISFAYTTTHDNTSLFGAQKSQNFLMIAYGEPTFYVGTSSALLSLTTTLNTDYEMVCHANNGTFSVSLNGKTNTESYSGSLQSDYSLYLFANNSSGTAKELVSAKIYSCKIYDNGTLVRNFIPCKNASGTAGLYDIVNNVFYGNAGSSSFAEGSIYDPTLAKGKHNVSIDSTAYKIIGGKVLVNGTGYGIVKGRTLIAGTGYDITFKDYATIKIVEHRAIESGYVSSKGSYDPYVSLVNSRLNADKIWQSTNLKLEVGTVLYVFAGGSKELVNYGWGDMAYGYIRINGSEVARYSDGSTTRPLYQYIVNGNATINLHGGGLRDINEILQSVSWVIIEED